MTIPDLDNKGKDRFFVGKSQRGLVGRMSSKGLRKHKGRSSPPTNDWNDRHNLLMLKHMQEFHFTVFANKVRINQKHWLVECSYLLQLARLRLLCGSLVVKINDWCMCCVCQLWCYKNILMVNVLSRETRQHIRKCPNNAKLRN